MSPLAHNVIQSLAILVIVGQLALVYLVVGLILVRTKKNYLPFWQLVGDKGVLLSLVVVLVATFGSLFFSEIAGLIPCKLCWFERIFMYPLGFLFGITLIKKDRLVGDYGVVLAGMGLIISGYHYLLQMGWVKEAACSAVGNSVSCSATFAPIFGYVTIPLMAFSAFALVIALLISSRSVIRQ